MIPQTITISSGHEAPLPTTRANLSLCLDAVIEHFVNEEGGEIEDAIEVLLLLKLNWEEVLEAKRKWYFSED